MLSSSDSSSDESDHEPKLKINQKFARRYEEQKRYQELQRNQDLLGNLGSESDSESESSSEDEDAVGLSTALDVEIMNTISSIKKKDPKIYEKSTQFYSQNLEDSSDDDEEEEEGEGKIKKKTSKKKTYKDVVREQLLQGQVGSDDDTQDQDVYYDKEKALAYDQEQERIRQDFLTSAAMDSDDSNSNSDGDMMTLKPKSAAERAEEESRLQAAIQEAAVLTKKDTDLDPQDEDFLTTYMLQKKWMDDADLKVDKKATDVMSRDQEDELLDAEDDEEELYQVDQFESKYNFRFEEEQAQGSNVVGGGVGEVVGHARNVEGSLRRVDDKRKKQREERKERKERERRVKEEELRRLKNLKREELMARLRQIAEVCGVEGAELEEENSDAAEGRDRKGKKSKKKKKEKERAGIKVADLDEDWDPEKHEALMQSQFNDDYYAQEDPDFAPGGKYFEEGAEDDVGEGYSAVGGWNEAYDEDDEEYHPQHQGENEGAWDDDEGELGNEELDAELYKLDYEDIVAGIPCRFKYATVERDDYGLTIDDILDAEDSELNKYVGLKKVSASYRQARKAEGQEAKLSRKRKHLREAIKSRKAEAEEKQKAKDEKKLQAEKEKPEKDNEKNGAKKSKRKRNKKKVIGGNLLATATDITDDNTSGGATLSQSSSDKKQDKKRRRGGKKNDVSDKTAAKKRRMDLYD